MDRQFLVAASSLLIQGPYLSLQDPHLSLQDPQPYYLGVYGLKSILKPCWIRLFPHRSSCAIFGHLCRASQNDEKSLAILNRNKYSVAKKTAKLLAEGYLCCDPRNRKLWLDKVSHMRFGIIEGKFRFYKSNAPGVQEAKISIEDSKLRGIIIDMVNDLIGDKVDRLIPSDIVESLSDIFEEEANVPKTLNAVDNLDEEILSADMISAEKVNRKDRVVGEYIIKFGERRAKNKTCLAFGKVIVNYLYHSIRRINIYTSLERHTTKEKDVKKVVLSRIINLLASSCEQLKGDIL